MSDFQQFADSAAMFVRLLSKGETLPFNQNEAQMFQQAERHARLLQALWEWANTPDTLNDHSPLARAHVRSLLVGPHEDK